LGSSTSCVHFSRSLHVYNSALCGLILISTFLSVSFSINRFLINQSICFVVILGPGCLNELGSY
jgi:hypothetical protein